VLFPVFIAIGGGLIAEVQVGVTSIVAGATEFVVGGNEAQVR